MYPPRGEDDDANRHFPVMSVFGRMSGMEKLTTDCKTVSFRVVKPDADISSREKNEHSRVCPKSIFERYGKVTRT